MGMNNNKNILSVWRLALAGWMVSFSFGMLAQTAESVNSPKESGQESVQKTAQAQEPRRGSTQFNGLDYLLQKPAKNEKFESKRFGDHLFFAGEGGITMLRNANSWFATPGVGGRIGVSVGDWFTPVHGVRLGVNAGWHNGVGGHDPYFTGLTADYLMNITALLHKYNPSRMFELIGVAGLEYQLLYGHNQWTHTGGMRLGMQTRFNMSPLTFFYLEPRFGIYADGIDEVKTWRHWDWEASLVAGFGYRLLSEPVRKNKPFVGWGRGIFISAGAGFSALWNESTSLSLDLGGSGVLAVGNQFSPVSAFRLMGSLHYFPQKPEEKMYRRASFGLQLDYLCDMHALFGGHNPGRRFKLSGVLGAGIHDVSLVESQHVRWSVGAGLNGDIRLNDHLSLFLEPRLDFFANRVWKDRLSMVDPMPSLYAGLTYYPMARSLEEIVKGEDFDFHSPIGNAYVTLGGGFAGIMSSSFASPLPGKGFRVAGGVGTQWTAVSGARAMMTFTSIDNPYYTAHRTLGIGAQLDYVLYFNNLFWGYKPNRFFEINGLLGLNYDYVSSDRYCHSIALGTGLQGTFRLGDMFEIYLEPRLHAGLNNKWEKRALTRIDVIPTFLAGVNYNLYGYSRKHNIARANEPFSNESFSDHMFMGVGAGANALLYRRYFSDLDSHVGPMASIYVGKWFSPASGLRASISGATYGDGQGGKRKAVFADISYLWNINSTLYGYNPNRLFETTLGVGVSLAYATSRHTGFHPGFNLSLQGLWRLNSNWGIFLEPQMRFFGQKFSNVRYAYIPFDMHTALQAGVQYQLDGYDAKTNRAVFENNANNYFLSAAYTARSLKRSASFFGGHGAALAFGKWYTPLSAWRLGIDYGYYLDNPRYMSLAFTADYLFNLSAYMWDYKPKRVFDLLAVAGVEVGAGNTRRKNDFVFGFKAGVQGKFNLCSHLDLFVEPQVLASRVPRGGEMGFTPEVRLLAGLNYKMGRKTGDGSPAKLSRKNFVSVSGGASMFSESILMKQYRKVSGAFDISYGRWFNATSGLQVGYGYDPIQGANGIKYNINSLHLDYLLNFTSLFNSNLDRRFDLIGAAGAGMGWSEGKSSWLGEGRLQFRWNVSKAIGLYVEPSMTLWGDKMLQDNTHNFVGVGRLSGGLVVRF